MQKPNRSSDEEAHVAEATEEAINALRQEVRTFLDRDLFEAAVHVVRRYRASPPEIQAIEDLYLTALYGRGKQLYREYDLPQACLVFQEIVTIDQDYQDAAQLLREIEQTLWPVAKLFRRGITTLVAVVAIATLIALFSRNTLLISSSVTATPTYTVTPTPSPTPMPRPTPTPVAGLIGPSTGARISRLNDHCQFTEANAAPLLVKRYGISECASRICAVESSSLLVILCQFNGHDTRPGLASILLLSSY